MRISTLSTFCFFRRLDAKALIINSVTAWSTTISLGTPCALINESAESTAGARPAKPVAIYNLITADTIDADIYERCLLRIGVFERALGANEAILGSITRELTSVAKNLALSSAERQAKLDQLADNSIRLVREQQDLEVRQTELFGLQVPATSSGGMSRMRPATGSRPLPLNASSQFTCATT